ncbi:MAG: sigma-54-dependent Fis family transcriptional regulator [Candidatus Marinimicrobia bacterium]|jgi:two-component system NtrC family response regulator|nr:sigma-54-dependent Fis family transcriptional regulator [Candidatus Neomarinimicrobiota bacterium]MBT3632595.1 sigma-54-dependent Fis family transcriptional regulator [Candidatus Neomarinimicrobiota bacterium]MBT3824994.1 sigma-54-dependent Fis family transcriptional regulator [Candidatus Neomarinimicrobiota bacterium]MBT4129154.1 sigma-54-dependent Fis family transcriptional regulator [Candidatus Neomarinimicrobiota bacterium]MBT4295215.1 sigma-54-dependent Fis family transcriptional regula
MTRLLIVDDEKLQRDSLAGFLKKIGYEVSTADSAQTALAHMHKHPVDIVLSDYKMPYMTGADLLKEVKSRHPNVILVLITAFGTVDIAVDAMKSGAWDFLTKPVDLDQLETLLKGIVDHIQTTQKLNNSSIDQDSEEIGFLAKDPVMLGLLQQAKRVAGSQVTVLITGETGVGKEVLADYIHQHSPRSEHPMVAVNCAALPSHLIESELFGHEKGAFTGATATRTGRFEEAHEGTLFLDEIGDLPLEMQTKLLRFLQSGEFQRIGENKVLKSDVRVIAATNVNLLHAIEIGEFREDLYYRLNVINLEIPPLRSRPDDIAVLSKYFLEKFSNREGRAELSLSNKALVALEAYHFPGNVRELGNLLERAVLLCQEVEIQAQGLNLQSKPGEKAVSGKLKDSVGGLEVDLIKTTLEAAGGNQSECARRLGISERVLRYKLQKYHLK